MRHKGATAVAYGWRLVVATTVLKFTRLSSPGRSFPAPLTIHRSSTLMGRAAWIGRHLCVQKMIDEKFET
jgi:hypothetical protein